jgi:hypothetical protein
MPSLATAAGLLAASLLASPETHSLVLPNDHGGQAPAKTQVAYAVRPHITMRTLGVHAPTRADQRHCAWEARLVVTRKLQHGAHDARKIHEGPLVAGRELGACAVQAAAIKRQAIAKLGDPARMLQQVAERDHALLLAEAEALRKAGG